MKSIYHCPVCNDPLLLHEESKGLHCSKKHHFDKNEHGYWEFSQAKKPRVDSRQVMRAKRFLLESGIFSPVNDAITEVLGAELAAMATDGVIEHLDYDCGEGSYLRVIKSQLAERLNQSKLTLVQHGISEAENALFSAAKIESELDDDEKTTLIVSHLKLLPFAPESFDLVSLIDKQLKGKEPIRVLKQGGYLLQVSPAPRHLWQLKEYLYPDMKEKELQSSLIAGFEELQSKRVSFNLSIEGEQALTLLEMTPYAWRANDKVRKQIAQASFAGLEIDFVITLSKKL
ncbi:putative RNA methyltransferase [Shewanella sp. UCD-KL12]|uniref:putative RNA methyltransferase n=1 Tax=Shewanella sp. UCD-KL12 TaxID=1917163 RepID=UPI0009709299|nr:SAM-dependent methyltransferase [Shewanella sp. UCD-KL12]